MKKGFTLIELLVVLAIIGILSTIGFQAIERSQAAIALDQAAHKVAQDITRAAHMSLRGEPFNCSPGQTASYGLHFDSSMDRCYFIYAECDNVTSYDSTETCGAPPGSGADKIAEKIFFERRVEIAGVAVQSIADYQTGDASILFVPPKPTVSINGSTNPDARVTITLSLRGTRSRTIVINQQGTVEIR